MVLEAIDYAAEGADRAFVESLRVTGFGVLKNHPIQQSMVQSIYDHWGDFFRTERKYDFTVNRDTQDGYFSPDNAETAKGFEKKDIKEYFHYYPWGQCPAELKAELQAYYDAAHTLAAELLGWVEQYSPAEIQAGYREPLSNMINGSDVTLLRILHYPPLTGTEDPGQVRAAAHADINLLTILPAANTTGLQVLSSENEWLDVPCEFENLIINIGDMLQEASGGYFPSTQHRVINPQGEARDTGRLSLPLFLHPRPDVVLSDRHTAKTYLDERLRELKVV